MDIVDGCDRIWRLELQKHYDIACFLGGYIIELVLALN